MAAEENPVEWTMDVFRPFVESTLDEWKRDMLFIETGLGATDTILKEGEDVPPKSDKSHPFNKIVNLIVKKIAKEHKLEKQAKKTMIIMLRNQTEEMKAIISARQNQSPVKKKKSSTREESAVDNAYQSQNAELSPKQLQMKETFEKKKREILDSLPDKVKARFGQQYFVKWGKSQFPVLVLSPYSVPPGGIRDMWFNMYEKVKKQDRVLSATNLIYWYGAYDDPLNAYSFFVTQSLTPYSTAVKKNLTKIPNAIQKKIDAGMKLCSSHKMLVEGLAEMEEDRTKEPEERHGRMVQAFLEDWELPEEEAEEKPRTKPKNSWKRKNEAGDQPMKEKPKPTPTPRKSAGKRDAGHVSPPSTETAPPEKRRRTISEIGEDDVINASPTSNRTDNGLQPRLDEALSEIERLNSLLAQTKQQVKGLESQIQTKNKENVTLRTENESLQEEMEQIRMNIAMELGFAEG